MNINITSIKINSISNIGSFNVGKTIICHNKASMTSLPFPDQEALPQEAVVVDAQPDQDAQSDQKEG